MMRSEIITRGLLPGAAAGVIGGLIVGIGVARFVSPPIAAWVPTDSAVTSVAILLSIAAIIGAGFGLLVWHQQSGAGEIFFWGLGYGVLWWFLGPLTLMPLLTRGTLAWDVRSAQAAFPSLLGLLLYGAVTGLTLAVLRWIPRHTVNEAVPGSIIRGAVSGLLTAWVVGTMLARQHELPTLSAPVWSPLSPHTVLWVVSALAGAGFAILYPRSVDGAGPALVRGTVYGFFCWVAGVLTLLPLMAGVGVNWSVASARANFAMLPGSLLFGAGTALAYQWFTAFGRLLFSDKIVVSNDEGLGAEGLRAVGRGAVAGLLGGLIFTLVMVRIGFLPTVARLIGSHSPTAGFITHLVIAELIGASYGLLFRRQSYDLGSALGWGVSYGFFWWILGPLTLLPILLGAPPQWTPEVAAGLSASLVGHVAYGAALGMGFHLVEARYNPWWIPLSSVEADRAERRKEQVLTSAPGLWALVLTIALTVPIVLGM
jgi:uncharacterized membrane protein YagU involved in acid resistance